MKRILFTLMTLAAVLSVGGVGSLAYFSDTETSRGNIFTAGTLDLKVWKYPGGWVDEPCVPAVISTAYWDRGIGDIIDNLKPGDEGTFIVPIRNDGSVDGMAQLQFTNLVDYENGCNEPECIAEGGSWVCDGYGGGHGRHRPHRPHCPHCPPWSPWPPCPPGPCQCEDCDSCGNPGPGEGELSQYLDVVVYYDGQPKASDDTLYDLVTQSVIELGPLEAYGEEDVVMVFSIDYNNAGNIIQSDSVDFDISFELIQPEP